MEKITNNFLRKCFRKDLYIFQNSVEKVTGMRPIGKSCEKCFRKIRKDLRRYGGDAERCGGDAEKFRGDAEKFREVPRSVLE